MNRIDAVFERTRAENRAALIVFVTAGDPDLETTEELIPELAAAGADIVELGVPHSDPIAEGPTIQASSARAVAAGTTLAGVLAMCARVRKLTDVPLVAMGYLNNVLARGEDQTVAECAASGIDGLIIVDAPHEEGADLSRACEAKDVHRILLIAPTSTPERVVQIASLSRGFVYCVSTTGVTGARNELPPDLAHLVAKVRRVTDAPVCVGFGISTPEHAVDVARMCDGVIVGSALVSRIAAAKDRAEAIASASGFVRSLSEAMRSAKR
ncbi:MAG: tryptophan synthase subunit alpha [bacterium]|nr:tryptophan synthase subunit alpha [bacterium]